MKLSKLMMAFAMCAVTLTGTAQTKVIAHRGYWKCEVLPKTLLLL